MGSYWDDSYVQSSPYSRNVNRNDESFDIFGSPGGGGSQSQSTGRSSEESLTTAIRRGLDVDNDEWKTTVAVPRETQPSSSRSSVSSSLHRREAKKSNETFDIFKKKPQNLQMFEQKNYPSKSSKTKPKQVKMDEFLFKARRVDKGSREFGLITKVEPKRGSKKKRVSVAELEIEQPPEEPPKKRKMPKSPIFAAAATPDILDSVLNSPSPIFRKKPKQLDIRKYQKRSKIEEIYTQKGAESMECRTEIVQLKEHRTVESPERRKEELKAWGTPTPMKKSPEDTVDLDATVPLNTPSPARKNGKLRMDRRNSSRQLFGGSQEELDATIPMESPVKKPSTSTRIQQYLSYSSTRIHQPTFDIDDPITISDNDDVKPTKNRIFLDKPAKKRAEFAENQAKRDEMMSKLMSDDFIKKTENRGEELRNEARNMMKDGQVHRGKMTRTNLMHGADCKCCRGYYDGLEMDEEERKKYVNQVSRHRYVHQPLPDTPPRYWDLTMAHIDVEEMERKDTTVDHKPKNNWNIELKKGNNIDKW